MLVFFNSIYNFLSDITEDGSRRRDEGRSSRQGDINNLRDDIHNANYEYEDGDDYYDDDILVLPPEENIEVLVTTTAMPTTTRAPTLGTVKNLSYSMLNTNNTKGRNCSLPLFIRIYSVPSCPSRAFL